jgi:hypothetical protein
MRLLPYLVAKVLCNRLDNSRFDVIETNPEMLDDGTIPFEYVLFVETPEVCWVNLSWQTYRR